MRERSPKIREWVARNTQMLKDARSVIEKQGYDMSEPVDLLLVFLEEGLARVLETDPDKSWMPRK